MHTPTAAPSLQRVYSESTASLRRVYSESTASPQRVHSDSTASLQPHIVHNRAWLQWPQQTHPPSHRPPTMHPPDTHHAPATHAPSSRHRTACRGAMHHRTPHHRTAHSPSAYSPDRLPAVSTLVSWTPQGATGPSSRQVAPLVHCRQGGPFSPLHDPLEPTE